MSTGPIRFRIPKERVPRVLFALSARCGPPVRRVDGTLETFLTEGRPPLLLRTEGDARTLVSPGSDPLPLAGDLDLAPLLERAGYRGAGRVPMEAEVYRSRDNLEVVVDHVELDWFCEIHAPDGGADELLRVLELSASDRDPGPSSASPLAARRPQIALAAQPGSGWPIQGALIGAGLTLVLVLIVGVPSTIVVLIGLVVVLAVVRAVGAGS